MLKVCQQLIPIRLTAWDFLQQRQRIDRFSNVLPAWLPLGDAVVRCGSQGPALALLWKRPAPIAIFGFVPNVFGFVVHDCQHLLSLVGPFPKQPWS